MGAIFQDGVVVIEVRTFSGHAPNGGIGGKQHLNFALPVKWCVEQGIYEFFDYPRGDPSGTKPHFNVAGSQIPGLHGLEG